MRSVGEYMAARQYTDDAAQAEGDVWYSEPEVRLAEALTARGLPFEQQVRVERGNTTAVLDFLVHDVLVIEVDGREFHSPYDDVDRDRDMRVAHGYWTIRVPGWKAFYRSDDVVCLVALKLSELGVA